MDIHDDTTTFPEGLAMDSTDTAPSDDEAAFGRLAERYRGELQVHCYRMLGSYTDAEDHVQETMLRAWRRRSTFQGRSTLRAWLYRIATNVCLDTIRRDPGRVVPSGVGSPSEIPWLQPYPDRLLDTESTDAQPDAVVVAKETIELAFLAALQWLSPNQRAVLILCDVLGWPPAETAVLLDTSVASVNSALQRARGALRKRQPVPGADQSPPSSPSADEQVALARYMSAHERADAAAVVQLLREDVRFTMPPQPTLFQGRSAVAAFFVDALGPDRIGDFRLVATRANRQPAAANYVRRPGEEVFRAMSLDVLRIESGRLVEITTFEPHLFPAFALPATL